ncbi:hypothetical protein NM688_g5631 [Phlebia brevispora]|uniref:Uncharacterized protein n=1 Tax=Phlebia brevispora TaxID=194682 RepID=A0ACC1SSR2_9APHY|nr:hypothetical protein NM688_g5631 [Phlebia brevispora]
MPSSVMNTLPQYGFGPEVTFEGLVAGNPFLFRVHTPRTQPPQYDSSEPYFVGAKYNDEFSTAAISSSPSHSPRTEPVSAACKYADVVQHLDWTTRASSPYISTSFSFAWAIWEAIRRYHVNVKHDVEIAVIDARVLADRSITAVELLMRGSPKERHKDHWKWYRFALESQDVLVCGYIPGSAVLASIPLLHILNRLPSYFLYHDISEAKDSPLFKLGWDYTRKKPSYRQFCQTMTDRFMAMPVERRLRDTTVGSVRLALAFLRPYIHKRISEDFSGATTRVSELAYVIAQWPGQWWTREHPEIQDLCRCIVHMVGEEMREARRVQALADATRMQEIVGGLEQLAHAYESRSRPARMLANIHLSPQPSPSPTLPPSPSSSEPKHAYRIGSVDIITDDMTVSKAIQTEGVGENVVHFGADDIAEMVEELDVSTSKGVTVPSWSTQHVMETAARTASCFLTGLLVGSFLALCVLSPDRRQLAHHLT